MADKPPADEGSGVFPVSGARFAPNQNFEKSWTLGAAPDAIEKLQIAVPGLVYVSHDASTPSSVRFSSDSSEILQHVEVDSDAGLGVVHVRAKGSLHGHLLTEISLRRKAAVQSLACAGSATTVVEDGVLVSDDSQRALDLDAKGSGDLFVGSSVPMRVHSLLIHRGGSGDVQLVAPAVECKAETRIRVEGSGDVNVFTSDLQSQSARLEVAGSGDVSVEVANALTIGDELLTRIAGSGDAKAFCRSLDAAALSASVAGSGSSTIAAWEKLTAAATIKTDIAGSGNVAVACAGAGATALVEVNVAGSGNVDVADVLADSSNINIAGSGNVAARVRAEARESLFGSGDVQYVGGQPQQLHTSGRRAPYSRSHATHMAARPLAAALWRQQQRFPSPVPAREAAFSQIHARHVAVDGAGFKSAIGALLSVFRS